mmetsp:Transcript_18612/g.37905  ORF Transcript_18612/g.37905 Transcript_18612/m.37905 type:complete len:364 (+) Transcript_18612:167-1258(+)
MSTPSPHATSKPPNLVHLALDALCRNWSSSTNLDGLSADLAKLVWTHVKDHHARQGITPMPCAAMYPLVRATWQVSALDLSDAGKWLTDTALQALAYLPSLRSVRLTACKFISNDGLAPLAALPQLETLDISWSQVNDAGLKASVARCSRLTSLNLTGLAEVTDDGVAALLGLTGLRRLALCCTGIGDAALDYLTYYTRFPEAATPGLGLHGLEWLELSNTRLTDVGVGKLIAIVEDGVPYGKVFKELSYLALSMTSGCSPATVGRVKHKYGLDTPLPNAQRTLAKSNAVAQQARDWVIRFMPQKDRQLPKVERSWEESRAVGYVAQYTKELSAQNETLRLLNQGRASQHGGGEDPAQKRPRV